MWDLVDGNGEKSICMGVGGACMVDIGFWGLPKQGEMEQMTQDGCGNWGLARKSMNVRGINNKKSD